MDNPGAVFERDIRERVHVRHYAPFLRVLDIRHLANATAERIGRVILFRRSMDSRFAACPAAERPRQIGGVAEARGRRLRAARFGQSPRNLSSAAIADQAARMPSGQWPLGRDRASRLLLAETSVRNPCSP